MSVRLIMAIISTLLEEAAIAVVVLWGLPRWLGIQMPLPGLVGLMVAWGAYSVVTYRIGSRALKKKPVVSLPDMVGSTGKVVSPLVPEGLVRIRGELWMAKSESGEMQLGREVTVVAQDGLKLLVRASDATDDSEKTG